MSFGYHNKILMVDLTNNRLWVDSPGEEFFRRYMGGGLLGAYYVMNNVKPGTDAFDPSNVIVFGGSVVTGFQIAGFTRNSVCSISPLTGGLLDNEAGGFWGRELKAAGFDAVVVQGKAEKPVYLWLNNGIAEIKDASHLWGTDTAYTQETIRKEYGDKRIRVLSIGIAGENKVRYASIVNDLNHVNARGGLGAVMGSKNLKCIAARGNMFPAAYDENKVKAISKKFIDTMMITPASKDLRENGTMRLVNSQNKTSQMPTRNWQTGYFPEGEKISATEILKTVYKCDEGCYGCPVACKRVVQAEKPYEIDSRYGGPEYESLAALGSYTYISDVYAVCKGNELCNKYSLDTISTGSTIAFAMDCYEKGLLSIKDTDGIDLRFGNSEVLVPIIEKIARREGIGDLLAEGVKRIAAKLGPKAQELAVHVKGTDFPAHEPRVKKSLALIYSISPIGADHMASVHDGNNSPATPAAVADHLKTIGIYDRLPMDELNNKKVIFAYRTQLIYSILNTLDICVFVMAPARAMSYNDVVEAVRAVTGWNVSLYELMLMGEKRVQMMRAFNIASGFTKEDDMLPPKMFEPLVGGSTEGKTINRDDYMKAISLYYKIAGWNEEGIPKAHKFIELDLDWVLEKLPEGICQDF